MTGCGVELPTSIGLKLLRRTCKLLAPAVITSRCKLVVIAVEPTRDLQAEPSQHV